MAAPFFPPLFESLGKGAADLFKKKFDYRNQVQIKTNSATGLSFSSTGEVAAKGVAGNVNLKFKEKFGDVEADLATDGRAKAEVRAKQLAQGVVLTVKAETNPKRDVVQKAKAGGDKPAVNAKVDYVQEFFSGSVALDTTLFEYSMLTGSAVIGYDGLSVGGELKLDANSRSELEDYNVAAQYQEKDIVGTVKTEDKAEKLVLSYFQKVSGQQTVGAKLSWPMDENDARTLELGTEYQVDETTHFKLKGSTTFKKGATEGEVAGVIEHRLKNPSLLFALSTSYNVANTKAITPNKFGVALTFGDY